MSAMFTRSDIPRLKNELTLEVELLGQDLMLKTRWGVFSPRAIDEGTQLLMRYLQVGDKDVCLDLGCGYGPIGIAMAKSNPEAQIHMVDKDFVAIELSNQNIVLNQLTNASAYLSDAFAQIDPDVRFDQVVSNVPAKVGREQLSIMLYDAFDAMKPGAKITFVTINGLRSFVKNNFKSVFGNYKKIKQGQKYTVSQAVKID